MEGSHLDHCECLGFPSLSHLVSLITFILSSSWMVFSSLWDSYSRPKGESLWLEAHLNGVSRLRWSNSLTGQLLADQWAILDPNLVLPQVLVILCSVARLGRRTVFRLPTSLMAAPGNQDDSVVVLEDESGRTTLGETGIETREIPPRQSVSKIV